MPVGVHAAMDENDSIQVEAVIASLDGRTLLREAMAGSVADSDGAEALGVALAKKLLNMGGREILHAIGIDV